MGVPSCPTLLGDERNLFRRGTLVAIAEVHPARVYFETRSAKAVKRSSINAKS